jgi:hypothetical protein
MEGTALLCILLAEPFDGSIDANALATAEAMTTAIKTTTNTDLPLLTTANEDELHIWFSRLTTEAEDAAMDYEQNVNANRAFAVAYYHSMNLVNSTRRTQDRPFHVQGWGAQLRRPDEVSFYHAEWRSLDRLISQHPRNKVVIMMRGMDKGNLAPSGYASWFRIFQGTTLRSVYATLPSSSLL